VQCSPDAILISKLCKMSATIIAQITPPLCPDVIELLDDVVLLGSYQLDKESGTKTGAISILSLEAINSGHNGLVWKDCCTVETGAVFDAKWCAHMRGLVRFYVNFIYI